MAGLGRVGLSPQRALLAGAVLLSLSAAVATPQFRRQAIQTVHYDQGNPLWELDRRVMACTYCHVQERGGAPWNPFGQALQRTFQEDAAAGRARKFPDILYALLAAEKDADGDGYADVLEVYARTLPGDPESRPERPAADLRADFEKAGGAAQYAPKAGAKGAGATKSAPR